MNFSRLCHAFKASLFMEKGGGGEGDTQNNTVSQTTDIVMPRGTTPPPLVTSLLPSRSSAHPPQPLNARGSLWRPSHSPCVRRRLQCVSLPTCAQRGCRPSVGFVIRSEATHRITQGNSFHLLLSPLFYSFFGVDFSRLWKTRHLPSCPGVRRT